MATQTDYMGMQFPMAGQVAHTHSVQFYGTDAFLLAEVSKSMGAAIGTGDSGVIVATGQHLEGVATQLAALGIDVPVTIRQGRYVALDAAETLSSFMVDGRPNRERFINVIGGVIEKARASARTSNRVYVFGEMVAILVANGKFDAAIELEELWNDLAQKHHFQLSCAYPMHLFNRATDAPFIERIFAVHAHVIPAEAYSSLTEDEERLRAVTSLQQKAQALGSEIDERAKVQRSLEQREAELADFLENALEGIQQIGASQQITWANRATLNLLGYTADEYVGHYLSEFMVDKEAIDTFWCKLMEREDIHDYQAELLCKDGSFKQVLFQCNGKWEGDMFSHTRCFIHDVTERKRMERALHERHHDLAQAVVARDEFLSIAAHELRTPITSLRGFAQLILRDLQTKHDVTPERLSSAFKALDVQTKKLTLLVGRLLDASQIDEGKLRLHCVETDLAALVRVVLAQQTMADKHKLVYDGPEHVEARVDPMRFEQVVTNLVDNAIKFSPGGGSITVSIRKEDDGSVLLSVRDEGIGIAGDRRDTLFERFNQTVDEQHLSGMGLGLYITKEIVQLHGGSVSIEESGQNGSRFVVSLPADNSVEVSATELSRKCMM